MCFHSCFVLIFFVFFCCVFAGASTSLLAVASSSSHATMAPAMPRIDAPPPVSFSVGSLAMLANLQRDMQLYSVRLTALEDENRSLKDALLQIRCELSPRSGSAALDQQGAGRRNRRVYEDG